MHFVYYVITSLFITTHLEWQWWCAPEMWLCVFFFKKIFIPFYKLSLLLNIIVACIVHCKHPHIFTGIYFSICVHINIFLYFASTSMGWWSGSHGEVRLACFVSAPVCSSCQGIHLFFFFFLSLMQIILDVMYHSQQIQNHITLQPLWKCSCFSVLPKP